ncbi:MAG: apolipoprotein N-acyltransferase [Alphaproteobacteria bacterium]|nr:apolipoprotein N-acyltransferase [Alphaproteobacteria bacterium]
MKNAGTVILSSSKRYWDQIVNGPQSYQFCTALFLGSLGALAFAPFNFYFALIPIFSGLLLLLQRISSPKQAFFLGWVFGFSYFASGVFWVSVSFSKVGLTYLMPLVVVGFSLLLGIFPALACALTALWQRNPLQQVFLFSSIWSLTEWLRGHILSGFPWNLVGYAWDLPMLQVCAWVGIYGLSFLTIFLATMWVSKSHKLISVSLLIALTFWTLGAYRAQQGHLLGDTEINMRLVQPSLQQEKKWSPEHLIRNVNLHIALSGLEAEKPLKAIIWPEAAIPHFFENNPGLFAAVREAIPEGALLITGAPRQEKSPGEMLPKYIWNSLFVLNPKGEILGTYDKSHLVPFGEYVPLRKILPVEKLTPGTIDYSKGNGIKTLNIQGVPSFSPLICYEAIFPGNVIDPNSKPEWLLNLTNDAWYGHTSGPYQHLNIVRVRAIEEGIPLVRAANNGISAVIDAYGKILYQLDLDAIGFIDFALPKRLPYNTIFSSLRDIPFSFMIIIALLVSCLVRKRISYVGDQKSKKENQ